MVQDLKEQVRAQARLFGADLVGFAGVERFEGAPDGYRPTDIMPSTTTVISLARRLPLEVVINKRRYTTYSNVNASAMRLLDEMAFALSSYIEDIGFRAYPIPADDPYTSWDPELMRGCGDISHRHAAQAAGLGRLGKNTLLLTPQYGNRVNLTTILTTLTVPPDPLIEADLCPEDCDLCLNVCAGGALGDVSVRQKECRQIISKQLPKGYSVYGCWECRRVCPVGR